jgi:tetratricopeptide (TPR) repeat protein
MKSILMRITLISFLFVLFIPNHTSAELKTFIKEYTYQASEDDSRNSSRVIALREVKRLLLEELGTYLESETEVKNFQLTRDQITTLTAGIVQTEIIEEKWDGRLYWLKSKITADSDKVVQSINELRKDRQKTLELESMRKKSDELLKENERLRKELTAAKGGNRETQKAAYDKSIKELSSMEWLEKGHAASDHKEAIKAYSQAIELDPQNARAYYFRARSSDKNLAIQDYNKLLEIEPKDSEAYLLRAWTYKELKEDDLAIKESRRRREQRKKQTLIMIEEGITLCMIKILGFRISAGPSSWTRIMNYIIWIEEYPTRA